jgi:hypothetical protein
MADVLDDDLLDAITDSAGEAVGAAGDALVAASEVLADSGRSRRGRKSFLGLVVLILIGVAVWKILEQKKGRAESD